jgi:hypothetical protein
VSIKWNEYSFVEGNNSRDFFLIYELSIEQPELYWKPGMLRNGIVTKDDHVWIQTSNVYATNVFYVANAAKSSFTGMLIHEL